MTEDRVTVLLAGTFPVKKYRRSIPVWVKLQALLRAIANDSLPDPHDVMIDARELEFDHNPGLLFRDYDLAAGDFMPAQNDPDHIDARIGRDHDQKTFGRQADAEKTVTTAGSDIGNATHIKHVSDIDRLHQAKMAMKAGDPDAVARILGGVRQKSRLKERRKIPSRPFPKQHRPMRSARRG